MVAGIDTAELGDPTMLDSTSLAAVIDDVNHAHFHGIKIKKTEARAAIDQIVSRYDQGLPARVRAQANPNPRWAAIPKSFVLGSGSDLQSTGCSPTLAASEAAQG